MWLSTHQLLDSLEWKRNVRLVFLKLNFFSPYFQLISQICWFVLINSLTKVKTSQWQGKQNNKMAILGPLNINSRNIPSHLTVHRYLDLQQHGCVHKDLLHLFNVGLQADDVPVTRLDLTQGLARNPRVGNQLREEKRWLGIVNWNGHTFHTITWPTVHVWARSSRMKEIHTNIRREDGSIGGLQHLLQLFIRGHSIHWTRDKTGLLLWPGWLGTFISLKVLWHAGVLDS